MPFNSWTENVIVADADYVDSVAFNLIVNFERMLERRVRKADTALWLECVAIDGGMAIADDKAAAEAVQAVLVHDSTSTAMQNFEPGNFNADLDGKAFVSRVGECTMTAVQTEPMVDKQKLIVDMLDVVCQQEEVRRLMVVVPEAMTDAVRRIMQRYDSDRRRTTLITMQPATGGAFRHVSLGFSLMAALGISSKEIDEKLAAGR